MTAGRSTRRSPYRRGAAAAVAAAALALVAAGCGEDAGPKDGSAASRGEDGKAGKDTSGGGSGPLAEVKGGDGITLTIDGAEREKGGFVTVTGKVTNNTGKTWVAPGWQGDESELATNSASMAGAKLVDKADKKRYFILRDTEGRCLCTKFSTGFQPGDTKSWYAQFPAPADGDRAVDFQIADMPPAHFKISEG